MADAPVMDSPNGNTEAGGSAFDDLMFADSNEEGVAGASTSEISQFTRLGSTEESGASLLGQALQESSQGWFKTTFQKTVSFIENQKFKFA